MSSINTITIVGRLGADPELKYTQSGKAVCNFSVAVDRRVKGETDWFNVTTWEKLAENCSQFLNKGKQVAIRGRMESRKYEKDGITRTVWDLVAEDVQFLGSRDSEQQAAPAPQQQRQPAATGARSGSRQPNGRQVAEAFGPPPGDGLGMEDVPF